MDSNTVTKRMIRIDNRTFIFESIPAHINGNGIVMIAPSIIRKMHAEIVNVLIRHELVGPESFRFLRKYSGVSQQILTQLLGVSAEVIRQYEANQLGIPMTVWRIVSSLAYQKGGGNAEILHTAPKPPTVVHLTITESPREELLN